MKKPFAKNMKPDEYNHFKVWYDGVDKNEPWDFKQEFSKYCDADVVLLAKSILKFRSL